MPLLATLLRALFGNMVSLYFLLTSTKYAVRMTGIGILAAAYIACVVGFTEFVAPLIQRLFTTSYGQVIGLAFPPIAGTIVTGIVGLWGCIITKKYFFKFGTLALPKG